jgi:hypothetical protein
MGVIILGTSKRNLNSEIRKILKEKPLSNINEVAPNLTKKILTKRILSENFSQEETLQNAIHTVINRFNSLTANGFKGKSKKDITEDPISKDEFINMILEEIEEENKINSKYLEKSLKIVMSKVLGNDEFDIYTFAQLLFYEIIRQILIGQLTDNIKDTYEDISYDLIQGMVETATKQIVNNSVYTKVSLFIDKKISLNEVFDEIINQTSNASFGEF